MINEHQEIPHRVLLAWIATLNTRALRHFIDQQPIEFTIRAEGFVWFCDDLHLFIENAIANDKFKHPSSKQIFRFLAEYRSDEAWGNIEIPDDHYAESKMLRGMITKLMYEELGRRRGLKWEMFDSDDEWTHGSYRLVWQCTDIEVLHSFLDSVADPHEGWYAERCKADLSPEDFELMSEMDVLIAAVRDWKTDNE